MRISLISILKPIALSIATMAVLGLGQGVVRADEVFIPGSTSGQVTSAQQTPVLESTSMLLLGTSLAGAAGAMRRRLRARKIVVNCSEG